MKDVSALNIAVDAIKHLIKEIGRYENNSEFFGISKKIKLKNLTSALETIERIRDEKLREN